MIELTRLVDEAGGVTKFVLKNELIQELASQGIKHTPEDIVVIGRNPEGKILWLEKGNAKAGLEHILKGHEKDFLNKGISDIPNFIENEILTSAPIENGIRIELRGISAIYQVNGERYLLAYGTNGYIVSFYPL